jgi:hypothetical protein
MTCDEVIATLLEADPQDLLPDPQTELGRHLTGCERCRRAARLVEDGSRELDAWLDRSGTHLPALDVESILERAGHPDPEANTTPLEAGSALHGRAASGSSPSRLRARARWFLPLAAAAGLATILVTRQDPGALPGPDTATPAQEAPEGLALDVPGGRNAAVLSTDNPDITIVWIYGGET